MTTDVKAKIKSFIDLNAWQKGHELVLLIYRLTQSFPQEENFGLKSQLRRAAVSVTSNIAEGFSRSSRKEKLNFYNIAQSSLTEIQNQLIVTRDIGYLKEEFKRAAELTITVKKLLFGLSRSLKN